MIKSVITGYGKQVTSTNVLHITTWHTIKVKVKVKEVYSC